jgi:hypothetical protein
MPDSKAVHVVRTYLGRFVNSFVIENSRHRDFPINGDVNGLSQVSG